MESITIKVDDGLIKQMNIAMKPNYSTKTEFIREAIRDKIKEIRTDGVVDDLIKYFGQAKTKTSSKEERKIRELVGKKIAAKYAVILD